MSMQFYGFPQALLALDKERKTGGLIVVDGKAAPKSIEIKLGPLVKVHGSFFCKELERRPAWTNVYMMVVPRVRVLQCTFEMINAETQLLYASDYPHWDFDLPCRIWDLPFLSEKAKHNILGGTAARLFKLTPRNAKQKQNLERFGNLAA